MRVLQRTIIVLVLALVFGAAAHIAQGQELAPSRYCNHLADFAEAVATDRDYGTTQRQALELAIQAEEPSLRSDYVLLVQLAHHNRHYDPQYVAGIAFELCWATYVGR